MRIFVAGGTGTLGRPTVATLVSRGHDVCGLTRTREGVERLRQLGASGIQGDALDGDTVRAAVAGYRPDVLVHLLTALPPGGARRPSDLRATNTLRVNGTANLLVAARESGVRRVVGESFVGVYGANGDGSKTSEDAALPPVGHGPLRDTVLALRSLEQQLRDANQPGVCETTALRIGFLYGRPVPSFEGLIAQARSGRLRAPRLAGVAAFVHIVDAAAAIVAAVEQRAVSPVYNIVDDEPLPLAAFMAALAAALGAPPPRPIPRWLVRLAAPLASELGSAQLRLSNARARRELGWDPRYPTVMSGLAELAHDTQETA